MINNSTFTCTIEPVSHTTRPEDVAWATIFIWVANGIGFIYNLPQAYHTYKTKKTADISSMFLMLRSVASIMWIFYCSYFFMPDVLVSWVITFSSNMVIVYYKYMYRHRDVMNDLDNMSRTDNNSQDVSHIERKSLEPTENIVIQSADYDVIVLNSD
jgi:uncharacterized protein with PQ loop repeat